MPDCPTGPPLRGLRGGPWAAHAHHRLAHPRQEREVCQGGRAASRPNHDGPQHPSADPRCAGPPTRPRRSSPSGPAAGDSVARGVDALKRDAPDPRRSDAVLTQGVRGAQMPRHQHPRENSGHANNPAHHSCHAVRREDDIGIYQGTSPFTEPIKASGEHPDPRSVVGPSSRSEFPAPPAPAAWSSAPKLQRPASPSVSALLMQPSSVGPGRPRTLATAPSSRWRGRRW